MEDGTKYQNGLEWVLTLYQSYHTPGSLRFLLEPQGLLPGLEAPQESGVEDGHCTIWWTGAHCECNAIGKDEALPNDPWIVIGCN